MLPLVFEALYVNSRSHWNSTVHGAKFVEYWASRLKVRPVPGCVITEVGLDFMRTGLTCNVVKLFMEMDAKLFDDCSATYREQQEGEAAAASKLQEQWKQIEKMAEKSALYPKVRVFRTVAWSSHL